MYTIYYIIEKDSKKYNSKFPIILIDCTFITIKFKNKIMNLFICYFCIFCNFKVLHNLL